MLDELRLLAKAKTLDPEALTEIHNAYYGIIFRYIIIRVSDHEIAQDLTSEVFLRLLTALREKTAPQNTLKGWLFGVASRVISDHHRKHYRSQQVELNEQLPAALDDPSETIDKALTWQNLEMAMGDLTNEQKEVIALRFGSELPIQQVAEMMGKSEGAVKQLQARAIATLSRKLSKFWHGS